MDTNPRPRPIPTRTVADLRAMLVDLPDDMPVRLQVDGYTGGYGLDSFDTFSGPLKSALVGRCLNLRDCR